MIEEIEEVDISDLSGFYTANGRERRRTVYTCLLRAMSNEHKLELAAKVCRDILGQMPNGVAKD